MKIHWGLKLVLGLSAITCVSYYLDAKSKADLNASLQKISTGTSDLVGYNPAPMVVGLGLVALFIWIAYPYIKKLAEHYDNGVLADIFDADQDTKADE